MHQGILSRGVFDVGIRYWISDILGGARGDCSNYFGLIPYTLIPYSLYLIPKEVRCHEVLSRDIENFERLLN